MRWADFERELLADPQVRDVYREEVPRQRLALSLAHKRHVLRISQQELAMRARVTQRQVSALENGRANVTLDTLFRVIGALGIVLELQEKVVAFTNATASTDFTTQYIATADRAFATTKIA